jgi:hypothetical protein
LKANPQRNRVTWTQPYPLGASSQASASSRAGIRKRLDLPGMR